MSRQEKGLVSPHKARWFIFWARCQELEHEKAAELHKTKYNPQQLELENGRLWRLSSRSLMWTCPNPELVCWYAPHLAHLRSPKNLGKRVLEGFFSLKKMFLLQVFSFFSLYCDLDQDCNVKTTMPTHCSLFSTQRLVGSLSLLQGSFSWNLSVLAQTVRKARHAEFLTKYKSQNRKQRKENLEASSV